ncbi:hypothetical protein CWI37_1325p0020 [Hamiltosporidium tvaerminnensis]|uniref:Uncharacterized protein n=1 Tax=Hamiltosporidium tvaerminnensis TaxID=1176355 RepID=A0A4Q9KZ35_9MICR|nr:hypothetical protein CWI37_1325p0020 [Hamiltosporidium tvaerminnensis]
MYDGLSESQPKKIASIVDFYFDHIKTYTDEYLHELLLHFSTLISTISCAANLENNMELNFDFSPEAVVVGPQKYFYDASFESLFSFFLSVKYYNPNEKLKMYELTFSVPDTVLIEFSMLLFSCREAFFTETFYYALDHDLYKEMIKYISDPII